MLIVTPTDRIKQPADGAITTTAKDSEPRQLMEELQTTQSIQ